MKKWGFPKPEPTHKKKQKSVPKDVMKIVEERSGGVCEYCHQRRATDPHHICEIGMGGGNRIDSPVNILHVCRECHNHDNTKFLQDANEILRKRLKQKFEEKGLYSFSEIAYYMQTDRATIERQVLKGFLKPSEGWIRGKDIMRWMGVA